MIKFPERLDEENLLAYEVSNETLETAGGKEIAANFTLGSCTGLSKCPTDQFALSSSKDWRHRVKQHPELGQPGRYRRADRGMSSPQNWNELTILGDYHLPFGKAEAQAKAARWLWQSYII